MGKTLRTRCMQFYEQLLLVVARLLTGRCQLPWIKAISVPNTPFFPLIDPIHSRHHHSHVTDTNCFPLVDVDSGPLPYTPFPSSALRPQPSCRLPLIDATPSVTQLGKPPAATLVAAGYLRLFSALASKWFA